MSEARVTAVRALRRWRGPRPAWRAALAIVAVISLASCTLLGVRDVIQCESDSDCPAARATCAGGLCVAKGGKIPEADAGDEVPCTTTNECPQENAPMMCIDGMCARATTPACPVLLPADSTYREDRVVLVGVYLSSPGDSPARMVVQLALDEINRNLAGTRVAALLCEKRAPLSALSARDALMHLGKLHVPLVIGDFETSEIRSTGALSEEQRISIWSTLGNHATVRPDVSPYFRTSYLVDELDALHDAFQAVVDGAVVRAGEVNGEPIAHPVVAIAAAVQTPEVSALANHLASTLEVNGLADQLTVIPLESAFEPSPSRDNRAAISTILAQNPHVIVALGGDEILKEVVPAIEATSGAFAPVYVVGTRAKHNINDLVTLATQSKRPNFRARLFGVDFGGARLAHLGFTSSATTLTGTVLAGSFDYFYDAMYAAAYSAVYAAHAREGRAGPLTGEELTTGLTSVAHGDASAIEVAVGEDSLFSGAHDINLGLAVRFTGITGEWIIDPLSRARRGMGSSVFCFKPKAKDVGSATPAALEYYFQPDEAFDGGCATAK